MNDKRSVTIRTYGGMYDKFLHLCIDDDQTQTERLSNLIAEDTRKSHDLTDVKIEHKGEAMEKRVTFFIDVRLYADFRHLCLELKTRPNTRINQLILEDIRKNE